MPVEWSSLIPPVGTDGLEVEVIDSRGQTVAGVVSYEPQSYPRNVARWMPTSPLALDARYDMVLRVASPPRGSPAECGFVAFERGLSVETGDNATPAPTLTILSFEGRDTVTRELEVGLDLCGAGAVAHCDNGSNACCDWSVVRREREIVGEVVASGVPNEEPIYNLIRATVSGLPDGPQQSVFERATAAEHYWPYSRLTIAGSDPIPEDVCLNVEFVDVLRQAVVAEAHTCGFTAEYELQPFSPILARCPDNVCPPIPEQEATSAGCATVSPEGDCALGLALAVIATLRHKGRRARPGTTG